MDNVKNRIMSESDSVLYLASGLSGARLTPTADSVTKPRYRGVFDAYRQTWTETFDPTKTFGWNSAARIKNFYRVCRFSDIARPALTYQGVVPVVLRAFPTNAAALAVWEAVMRYSTRS